MGNFFYNLQIHIADKAIASMLDHLTAVLAKHVKSDGFVLAKPTDEAIREILVLVDDQSHWATVIDSAESFEEPEVRKLAQTLSKRCDTEVVSVIVEDSDILRLNLFNSGKRVDSFSNLSAFYELDAKSAAKLAGKPAKWQPLLAPNTTPDDLAQVWREKPTFVEDMLVDVAKLLQIDPQLSMANDHDVADVGKLPGKVALHLRFRLAAQARPTAAAEFSTLPTQFAFKGSIQGISGRPGDAIPKLVGLPDELRLRRQAAGEMLFWAINYAGASTGLAVTLGGSALEKGLVRITELVLFGQDPKQPRHIAVERVDMNGQTIWRAKADDVHIPLGLDKVASAQLMQAKQLRQAFELEHNATIQINMVGEILAAGEGELNIACIPLQHPAGAVNHSIPVYIIADQ